MLIAAFLALAAVAAFAQAPTPSPTAAGGVAPRPGPPIPYYASYGLIVLAGMTVLAVLAGYLFQAPGFRRASRGSSAE